MAADSEHSERLLRVREEDLSIIDGEIRAHDAAHPSRMENPGLRIVRSAARQLGATFGRHYANPDALTALASLDKKSGAVELIVRHDPTMAPTMIEGRTLKEAVNDLLAEAIPIASSPPDATLAAQSSKQAEQAAMQLREIAAVVGRRSGPVVRLVINDVPVSIYPAKASLSGALAASQGTTSCEGVPDEVSDRKRRVRLVADNGTAAELRWPSHHRETLLEAQLHQSMIRCTVIEPDDGRGLAEIVDVEVMAASQATLPLVAAS